MRKMLRCALNHKGNFKIIGVTNVRCLYFYNKS